MTNEELYDVPGLAAGAGGAGGAGGEAEGVGGDVVVDVDIAQQLARYTTHSHAAPSSQYCKLNYTGTSNNPRVNTNHRCFAKHPAQSAVCREKCK